jgi:5-methylcytosine-specific restriction endonuclease McrA
MTVIATEKSTRERTVDALRKRDGAVCMYPGCDGVLDFSIATDDDPRFVTIDHWIPQYHGKAEGWTYEQIWDLSNLRLMHKRCNAKKGDRIPNEDGTLPERKTRKFRYRRDKRAGRPDLCVACDNGHNLFADEICASCGCDAQRFPRSAKVRFDECDHEVMWCWVCSITPEMRPDSVGTAMRQASSDDVDELFDDESLAFLEDE